MNYTLSNVSYDFVFKANLMYSDPIINGIKSQFWRDVVECWCKFNYVRDVHTICNSTQIIWLNSHFVINGKILYNSNCVNEGLIYLGQFYENSQLLDLATVNQVYNVNLSYLEYYGILDVIPKHLKQ